MPPLASPFTRREFLHTAAATAALAATPRFARAGAPISERKVRLGIIGGRFGNPDDHKVVLLLVIKRATGVAEGAVRVTVGILA